MAFNALCVFSPHHGAFREWRILTMVRMYIAKFFLTLSLSETESKYYSYLLRQTCKHIVRVHYRIEGVALVYVDEVMT